MVRREGDAVSVHSGQLREQNTEVRGHRSGWETEEFGVINVEVEPRCQMLGSFRDESHTFPPPTGKAGSVQKIRTQS